LHDVKEPMECRETVECYSGYRYGERPCAFLWMGERLEIEEIESRAHTPEGWGFRVRTCSGETFELLYFEIDDCWEINPAA
jgi:hypothetical protein